MDKPMQPQPQQQQPAQPGPAPGPEPGPGMLDGSDDQMLQQLSDGISDYIHGPAREHLASTLSQAGDGLADNIAALSYQILSQVSDQIAKAAPEMVTLDLLLPLATEAIDYLIEMAEALKVPMPDLTELREDSLYRMIEIHMAKIGDDPEQKAIAEEMFAEFQQDGTFDEAAAYVDKRIKARGGDPAKIKAQGQQMAQPQPNKLSAGIQQGLLGSQQ